MSGAAPILIVASLLTVLRLGFVGAVVEDRRDKSATAAGCIGAGDGGASIWPRCRRTWLARMNFPFGPAGTAGLFFLSASQAAPTGHGYNQSGPTLTTCHSAALVGCLVGRCGRAGGEPIFWMIRFDDGRMKTANLSQSVHAYGESALS